MTQHISLTEEQRRFWYRRGKEAGAKQHAAIYSCCCEKHHARLLPVGDGLYRCLFCQLAEEQHPPHVESLPEPVERQTDAMNPIPLNRFLQWRMEQHRRTGPETDVHRALQWKK